MNVVVETVDGAPGGRESVADLEEEIVGEVEVAGGGGDVSVEFVVRGVLLLVEDCADSEEVVLVDWR
ncbi:hypothetical protein LINPERHAP1_LOCUS10060 [Linum perenne]